MASKKKKKAAKPASPEQAPAPAVASSPMIPDETPKLDIEHLRSDLYWLSVAGKMHAPMHPTFWKVHLRAREALSRLEEAHPPLPKAPPPAKPVPPAPKAPELSEGVTHEEDRHREEAARVDVANSSLADDLGALAESGEMPETEQPKIETGE